MSDNKPHPFDDVMLVPDVAKLLRCSEETVRRLVHRRLLKPLKGIRTMRFTRAEVQRYLAGR